MIMRLNEYGSESLPCVCEMCIVSQAVRCLLEVCAAQFTRLSRTVMSLITDDRWKMAEKFLQSAGHMSTAFVGSFMCVLDGAGWSEQQKILKGVRGEVFWRH